MWRISPNQRILPKLVELLRSSDEGYRYWGVIGCIQLGKHAATPEVLTIMEQLIKTDVKDRADAGCAGNGRPLFMPDRS